MKAKGFAEWRRKYYPVPAGRAPRSALGATLHSLRKWRGLRPKVLKAYGLKLQGGCVVNEQQRALFLADSQNCALCVWFISSSAVPCGGCPLAKRLGRRCDFGGLSPYERFVRSDDPEPMIAALEQTAQGLRHKQARVRAAK